MVDDDDGDESPSPEPRKDCRSALPREIRAWRWLRVVKRDETLSLILSPKILINSEKSLCGFAGHSENFCFLRA